MQRKRTRRSTREQRGNFFVGDRRYPSPGAALSYAQNLGSAWAKAQPCEERSFYVRDALDNVVHRVDVINGVVYTPKIAA